MLPQTMTGDFPLQSSNIKTSSSRINLDDILIFIIRKWSCVITVYTAKWRGFLINNEKMF